MASSFRCPACRTYFSAKGSFFPFCSERCKLLDLGAWASERYSIPAEEPPHDGDNPPPHAEDRTANKSPK